MSCLFILCFVSLPLRPVTQSHLDLDLDSLVRDHEYPALEQQLSTVQLLTTDRYYFEGVLANHQNHISKSTALLKQTTPRLRDFHRVAIALETLADDYAKAFRYADAARTCSRLLKDYANQLDEKQKQDNQDDLRVWQLLKNKHAARQTVAAKRSFTVAIRRDRVNNIEVPIMVGTRNEWWILDTGTSVTTIALSTAKRLGLDILESRGDPQSVTRGATGVRVTIIPRLSLGEATLENVEAFVVDDDFLSLDLGDNGIRRVDGILGLAALSALGSVTFDSGEKLIVGAKSQPSQKYFRLYMDEWTLFLGANVNGRDILFGLDTGADSSFLSVKYFRTFQGTIPPQQKQPYEAAIYGHIMRLPVYYVPRIELGLNKGAMALQSVPVFLTETGDESYDIVYGNLGRDWLMTAPSYTLDLRNMRLSFGESKQ